MYNPSHAIGVSLAQAWVQVYSVCLREWKPSDQVRRDFLKGTHSMLGWPGMSRKQCTRAALGADTTDSGVRAQAVSHYAANSTMIKWMAAMDGTNHHQSS
jgi:hypothetical protein